MDNHINLPVPQPQSALQADRSWIVKATAATFRFYYLVLAVSLGVIRTFGAGGDAGSGAADGHGFMAIALTAWAIVALIYLGARPSGWTYERGAPQELSYTEWWQMGARASYVVLLTVPVHILCALGMLSTPFGLVIWPEVALLALIGIMKMQYAYGKPKRPNQSGTPNP